MNLADSGLAFKVYGILHNSYLLMPESLNKFM